MLNEVLKICEKLYLLIAIKSYKNNKKSEIKDLVALSLTIFFKKYIPSKLEMQCKMDMYISFDFGCLLRTGRWDFFC